MTVEKLQELQQRLEDGEPLDSGQCAALIAEIWRLKTVIAGKTIEVGTARDEAHELRASLDRARAESDAIGQEIKELKEIHGLPACDLENRWSNCAVRVRKRAAEKVRRALERR